MKRPITEQVVVITGASTGIGRETALELARRGATVVAAARGAEGLRTLAAFSSEAGGRIITVPTDVSDWQQVEALAQEAVQRFGRIDTWVNAAAVTLYATVAESTVEEIERVIQVNLLGQVHGMKAAMVHMKAQGGGTIINISSVLGYRAVPLLSAYAASKHGIQGFTEALRMELEHDGSGIDVTVIAPSSINTPLFEHARSKLGALPKPVEPIYDPRTVAEAVIVAAESSRREIVVGGAGKALTVLQRISPRLLDMWMVQGGRMFRLQKSELPDDGQDNLFRPAQGPGDARGPYGRGSLNNSLYTRTMEYHPALKMVALGLLAPAVAISVAAASVPLAAIAVPIGAVMAGAQLLTGGMGLLQSLRPASRRGRERRSE